MPHCEICKDDAKPDQLSTRIDGAVVCGECVDIEGHEQEEDEFDWGVSFSRKAGLKAGVRLGGATLSLEVSPEVIEETFGTER